MEKPQTPQETSVSFLDSIYSQLPPNLTPNSPDMVKEGCGSCGNSGLAESTQKSPLSHQFVFYYSNQLVLKYQDQIERYLMDNIMTYLHLPIEIPQYQPDETDDENDTDSWDRMVFEDANENQNEDIFDLLVKNQLDTEVNRIYVSTTSNWPSPIKNISLKKTQVVTNSYDSILARIDPVPCPPAKMTKHFNEMRKYGDVYVIQFLTPSHYQVIGSVFFFDPSHTRNQRMDYLWRFIRVTQSDPKLSFEVKGCSCLAPFYFKESLTKEKTFFDVNDARDSHPFTSKKTFQTLKTHVICDDARH